LFLLFSTSVVDTNAPTTGINGRWAPEELVAKFAPGVVDAGGKFTANVTDTGGNFAAGVVDTGGKFATDVIDSSGAP
jgi:hypothetical protein